MDCFEQGERRASVTFSMLTPDGKIQPCKKMFYLYRDDHSGDILAYCVLHDLTEHQRREKELKDLEQQLQMSRIRNFTSQMQPHFLYNALGSIQEVVLDDPQYASELIGDFTVHLRSCIRAMTNDAPIPFPQELANIRAYTNIERMRFGDKLHYDIQISDDVDRNILIPNMLLHTYCQNAVKHGISNKREGGNVEIMIRKAEKPYLSVSVKDNGVGRKAAQNYNRQSTKQGMKILLEQIELFNQNNEYHITQNVIDLYDDRGEPIGTCCEMKIPYNYRYE